MNFVQIKQRENYFHTIVLFHKILIEVYDKPTKFRRNVYPLGL